MSNEPRKTVFGQSDKLETAIPIYDPYLMEDITENGNRSKRASLMKAKVTSNSYEESRVFDVRLFSKAIIQIVNSHDTNGIHYKVQGVIDLQTVDWDDLIIETTLGAGLKAKHSLSDAWSYLRVVVKSAVVDTAGIVSVSASGKNK